MTRHEGKTSQQMISAPLDTIFIWCGSDTSYPLDLARNLGRTDLRVWGRSCLGTGSLDRLLSFSAVVLDHATEDVCPLSRDEKDALEVLRQRKKLHTQHSPLPAHGSAQVIQLDDHRPQITITTHANKVHVIPVAFWMDVAKGHQTIDNLGDLRDSILRVVLGEWLVIKGVAEPEQLLTLEIGPCPDDS